MTDKQHFEDLTEIICPVSMLDEDTFQRLCKWPHGWEKWSCFATVGWRDAAHYPSRFDVHAYRAKPAPMRKMSPPWDVIDSRFNWAAMDSDGTVYIYTEKPMKRGGYWRKRDGARFFNDYLTFDRGTAPWDQSLVCRPGYEGDDA